MEPKTSLFEPVFERIEEYGKTTYELYKLKALDKTASAVSSSIAFSITLASFFFCILILNIGVSIWLGDLLGKSYYGFFCVAAFYGLIGIILYSSKNNWIKKAVSNSIISRVINN